MNSDALPMESDYHYKSKQLSMIKEGSECGSRRSSVLKSSIENADKTLGDLSLIPDDSMSIQSADITEAPSLNYGHSKKGSLKKLSNQKKTSKNNAHYRLACIDEPNSDCDISDDIRELDLNQPNLSKWTGKEKLNSNSLPVSKDQPIVKVTAIDASEVYKTNEAIADSSNTLKALSSESIVISSDESKSTKAGKKGKWLFALFKPKDAEQISKQHDPKNTSRSNSFQKIKPSQSLLRLFSPRKNKNPSLKGVGKDGSVMDLCDDVISSRESVIDEAERFEREYKVKKA
jgi:hypothetical protein